MKAEIFQFLGGGGFFVVGYFLSYGALASAPNTGRVPPSHVFMFCLFYALAGVGSWLLVDLFTPDSWDKAIVVAGFGAAIVFALALSLAFVAEKWFGADCRENWFSQVLGFAGLAAWLGLGVSIGWGLVALWVAL